MSRTIAMIVAAGRGHRASGELSKQFRPVAGQSVLRRSCVAFLRHPGIDAVRVVIQPADRALYEAAVSGLDLAAPVAGGETRQESCRLGLEALAADGQPDRVLIHDAARPFVDQATVDRVLEALGRAPAAIAGVPLSDTLKRVEAAGHIAGTIERRQLWRAQTPQGFDFRTILLAHRTAAGRDMTDDSAVAEAAGVPVVMVEGSEDNVKLTTNADFEHAERLLARRDVRVGSGFDVHRFGAGDHVMLCGVAIPHARGLQGHSDADVGLHALTDAILGAIAGEDIGSHFPPSDPALRDRDSALFLAEAVRLVAQRGGEIRHLDVTLICESPKISPHRRSMRARIGEITGLAEDRISVKATTTEGLGFTGRHEGIAAQATATVCL